MDNHASYTRNRVIAPILIGISIILAILVVKPLYLNYIDTSSVLASTRADLTKKTAERDTLRQIQNGSGAGISPELQKRVVQLDQKFVPSDIIQSVMLNKFTEKSDITTPTIVISSINVSKGTKLPSGLSLGKVNVALQAGSIEDIVNYITFLTTESNFAFTLDDVSLPIDTSPEGVPSTGYGLSLSLGVYYYE